MFKCVVNSWVLLLFVAHQCVPLIYGQNLALSGKTVQSSTYHGDWVQPGSSKAVDGDKSGIFSKNGCSSTSKEDKKPNLNLTFTNPVTVNRVILTNRLDGDSSHHLPRLQGFILRGFSRNNSELFTYTDTNPVAQRVYTVQLDEPVSDVAMLNVEATSTRTDPYKILIICELEVFSGCEVGWFGPGCRLKCHCSGNKCTTEGLCTSGSKCVSGWFGPTCQYADQLTSDTFVQDNPALVRLFDGDESTCLAQATTEVTLTWTRPFEFTWLRVKGQYCKSLNSLIFSFKVQVNSPSTECKNRRDLRVSDTTMDVYCDVWENTTQVTIAGSGVLSLCSLYVSGAATSL